MILRSVWAPPWRQPDRWFAAVNSKFDRPTAPTAHLPRPPHCVADINAPCMSRRARASPYSTPSALPATATASADADWEPSDKAALLEGDYGCVGIGCMPYECTIQLYTDGCGHTSCPRPATAPSPTHCKTHPSRSVPLWTLHAAMTPMPAPPYCTCNGLLARFPHADTSQMPRG